jgi:heavy metal sensor kinase
MPFVRLATRSIEAYGTLRVRVTLWTTLFLGAMLAVMVFGVRTSVWLALQQEIDQHLISELDDIDDRVLRLYPDRDAIQDELNRAGSVYRGRRFFSRVFSGTGELLLSSDSAPATYAATSMLEDELPITVDNARIVQRNITLPTGDRWIVRVGESIDSFIAEVNAVTRLTIGVGLVILIATPLLGYWIAKRATQPISDIIETASRIRPSDVNERLPVRGTGDELDRLCQTINGLLSRIAQYVQQNRNFTSNAAHELRSPLAAIQSSLEVTLNVDRDVETYKEALADVLGECESLRMLINNLLLLAESDAGSLTHGNDPVPLHRTLERTVDMFRAVAEMKGVQLSVVRLTPCTLLGNAGQIRQVLNNLLDNAIKFTPANGKVELDLDVADNGTRAVITVRDSGAGISAEELPRIFERFYRGDKSRQRERSSTGSGLGLAICNAIVRSYDGSIEVRSQVGKGTSFVVSLPGLLPIQADEPDAVPYQPSDERGLPVASQGSRSH